ncbi:MAG: transketolase C-terminal domain-containing protein [Actinomycetota bacterium]
MRSAFIGALVQIARQDPRVVLLTGDLGFTVIEPFRDEFPDRFYNAGVAEQNMVGTATGLAEAGFIPFVYSIVTFASLRAYEFVRNGPIAHRLRVRIIGVGGGFDYGTAGFTHYGLEDLGIMRMQPGITVLAPADHRQAVAALNSTYELDGPVYYRIGKDESRLVEGLEGRFELGRADLVGEGEDVLLITIGSMACEVVEAAGRLSAHGVRCSVLVVSSFNPFPVDDLRQALSRFSIAITIEAHYAAGGLGSAVAEVIADHGIACRLVRRGVNETPLGVTGSSGYMSKFHGLASEGLADTVLRTIEELSITNG